MDWNILPHRVQFLSDFNDFWSVLALITHFTSLQTCFDSEIWYLGGYHGVKSLKNPTVCKVTFYVTWTDVWIGIKDFRTWRHENSEISHNLTQNRLKWVPNPLIRLPSRSHPPDQEIDVSWTHYIHVSVIKNKNPQSENNHITITNTFWSTELNFRLILSHGGSICVSETRFDHFQSHKMEYRDKKSPQSKILESKTAREYSFLRSS